ncbi:MAG: type II toxin-antitoxin system HicB family antitoxin [Desulfosporosinus sp.]|nr:type II toxin-antitoxin system HicB family antitoxin [Desulfosporosinus sp.]
MSNGYRIILDWNEDEDGFTVTVPALPGCVTEGDTIEEALTNVKEAIKGYLRALEIQGKPIPAGEQFHFKKQELVINI